MTTAAAAKRTAVATRWRLAMGAVAMLAAVVVLACGTSALSRIGRPFAGFFYWENAFVPAVGLPGWSGAATGLAYHSWIEGIGGEPLVSVEQIDAAVRSNPVGTPIRYRVRTGDLTREVAVPTESFSAWHFAASTGVYLFDAVVLLLLAATMFYVGAAEAGPRAVGLFALAQSLYLSTAIDLFGPYRFRELYFFAAGLTPTATLFMISRFPVERRIGRVEHAALATAFAGTLAFGAWSNRFFLGNREGLLLLDRIVHFAMAASALAAFAFFAWHFLRGRSAAVRRRCQVVLLASLGGFLPTMVFLVAFYAGGLSLPFNFLAVPFVLFPLGIGYAVARHDLFDVDRIVKRTIVYTTLSAAVLGAYSLAIGTFDAMFEHAAPVVSRLAEGVLIVALILVFDPSRRRLQETVDRLYDRRRWVWRDVVRQAVRAFSTILDLDRLIPTVLGLVDDSVQPIFAGIYTIGDDGVPRLRGALLHPPGGNATIDVDREGAAAPEFAELARRTAFRDALTVHDEDGEVLASTGAEVALALALEGRPTGLLLVGPRRSGLPYPKEDLDLLRTIAGQLAVAMQNAESFRTIETLNRELAGTNVELAGALHDLRAAQDELVIKERLAAVGEIAGAVAHTIRNPLAGMRAAAQQAHIELAEHPAGELVDYFVRETDRLSSRIDSLLDFARPFHVAPKPCSLAEIARRAADQVRGRARERGVAIDDAGAAGEAPAVVDPTLFEQLAVELVANAVDASPDGACVLVRAGHEDAASFLEVLDSGPGIPEERRERMFRMFFTTKPKGTGIGLATVKRIADSHHATIEVEDAPGGGARFRVVVPQGADPAIDREPRR